MRAHVHTHTHPRCNGKWNSEIKREGERGHFLRAPARRVLNRLKTVTSAWGEDTQIPRKRVCIRPDHVLNSAGAQ